MRPSPRRDAQSRSPEYRRSPCCRSVRFTTSNHFEFRRTCRWADCRNIAGGTPKRKGGRPFLKPVGLMQEPLVDHHFLERLERLTLHWQKSFNGLVGGRKPSRFAGAGQEFLDHRNFHTGDDLRAVNWRAYMRFERFFLKTFQV